MNKIITYEHPLNETTRVCLRLKRLFEEIDYQLKEFSELETRNIVLSMIHVLHLLDRPDLKAKLAKELNYHLANLTRYNNLPEIDTDKLHDLTQQLEERSRSLIDSNGKIAYRLRDVELLNTLRLHLASPGGGCGFDVPLYHYWLKQPAEVRQVMIKDWLNDFAEIKTVIALILDLVRKNAKTEQKTAVHGFHQELLDPQANLRMICIGIADSIPTYPEISIGRHFLSIRFFIPDINKRPTQYTESLSFEIAYCVL